jgi:hypothetical protein
MTSGVNRLAEFCDRLGGLIQLRISEGPYPVAPVVVTEGLRIVDGVS